MSDTPPVAQLLARLDHLGVGYRRFDHPAVFTCDEADQVIANEVGGAHTKNLFLRDQKGRRHWLLVTLCSKQVDLRALAGAGGGGKLGLASPERLERLLGLTPGAVTVLGLINDPDQQVEVLIDEEVWAASTWRCHPLVNTATLLIDRSGIEAFLASTGHVPRIVTVPARAPSGSA